MSNRKPAAPYDETREAEREKQRKYFADRLAMADRVIAYQQNQAEPDPRIMAIGQREADKAKAQLTAIGAVRETPAQRGKFVKRQAEVEAQQADLHPGPTTGQKWKEAGKGALAAAGGLAFSAADRFTMGAYPALANLASRGGFDEAREFARQATQPVADTFAASAPSPETIGGLGGDVASMLAGPGKAIAGVTEGIVGQMERRIPAIAKTVQPGRFLDPQVTERSARLATNVLGRGVVAGGLQNAGDTAFRDAMRGDLSPKRVGQSLEDGAVLGGGLVGGGALAAPAVRGTGRLMGKGADWFSTPDVRTLEEGGTDVGLRLRHPPSEGLGATEEHFNQMSKSPRKMPGGSEPTLGDEELRTLEEQDLESALRKHVKVTGRPTPEDAAVMRAEKGMRGAQAYPRGVANTATRERAGAKAAQSMKDEVERLTRRNSQITGEELEPALAREGGDRISTDALIAKAEARLANPQVQLSPVEKRVQELAIKQFKGEIEPGVDIWETARSEGGPWRDAALERVSPGGEELRGRPVVMAGEKTPVSAAERTPQVVEMNAQPEVVADSPMKFRMRGVQMDVPSGERPFSARTPGATAHAGEERDTRVPNASEYRGQVVGNGSAREPLATVGADPTIRGKAGPRNMDDVAEELGRHLDRSKWQQEPVGDVPVEGPTHYRTASDLNDIHKGLDNAARAAFESGEASKKNSVYHLANDVRGHLSDNAPEIAFANRRSSGRQKKVERTEERMSPIEGLGQRIAKRSTQPGEIDPQLEELRRQFPVSKELPRAQLEEEWKLPGRLRAEEQVSFKRIPKGVKDALALNLPLKERVAYPAARGLERGLGHLADRLDLKGLPGRPFDANSEQMSNALRAALQDATTFHGQSPGGAPYLPPFIQALLEAQDRISGRRKAFETKGK